jgi:Tol biopolymer transport system component
MPAAPPNPRGAWLAGAAGLVLGAAALYAVLSATGPGARVVSPTWSNLAPAETRVSFSRFLEISPDGRRVVFVGPAVEDGEDVLWVRELASEQSRALVGTEGAQQPFWSPDSRSIGYFARRKLRRVDATGGVSQALADAGNAPRGGSWGEDGTILYVPDWSEAVHRVTETGGAPEIVSRINEERLELSHRWPHLLPDGKHFLYFVVSTYPELNPENPSEADQSGLYVSSLEGGEPKLLQTARSRVVYRDGSLLYVDDGILMARPFDVRSRSFTGDPVTLASGVTQSVDALWGGSLFSVSEEGTLLFVRGARERRPISRLVWRDRDGAALAEVGQPQSFNAVRLSHDGTRAATSIGDPGDIWLYDLVRGNSTRFTFDPGNDGNPVWSPDDTYVLFESSRVIPGRAFSPGSLFRKAVTGAEPEEHLTSVDFLGPTLFTTDWSPDGKHVAVLGANQGTGSDLLIYSMETGEFITFLQTEDTEQAGRFSPDGRWLAYESDESGDYEVYVRAFPGPGGKWQVSTEGGGRPVWRADGKELFYITKDQRQLMSVAVEIGEVFRHDTPKPMFDFDGWLAEDGRSTYDVTPDGSRFLTLEPLEDAEDDGAVITLVQGWR